MREQRMNTMLRLRDLRVVIKRCKTSIYKDVNEELLTKPVPIGARAVAWPADEVNKILAARIAGHGEDVIRALVVQLHKDRQSGLEAK